MLNWEIIGEQKCQSDTAHLIMWNIKNTGDVEMHEKQKKRKKGKKSEFSSAGLTKKIQ